MVKALDVIRDRSYDPGCLPQLGEVADGRFRDLRNVPSLQALKLHQFLFKAAGARVADDVWLQVDLAELRKASGLRNHTVESLTELLTELRGVVMSWDGQRADGQPFTTIAGLLDIAEVDWDQDADPVVHNRPPRILRWKFGEGLRRIAAASNYWAIIDRQTMFQMSSRYSLRLFELISVRIHLKHKSCETFTIPDLRARLGVPKGKFSTWNNLNQAVLKTAIAEVNHLARFTVSMVPEKRNRRVIAVELAWELKPDLLETKRELERHSLGRKARREGGVENIVPTSFPADGPISYNRWGDLARQHTPQPTPDVDLVASAFRKWAQDRSLSLDAKNIEKAFIGFCRQFSVVS